MYGAWAQGGVEMSLVLTRQGVVPTSSPLRSAPGVVQTERPSLSGVWLGTLRGCGKRLRLQVHLDLAPTPPRCSFESLDQSATAIPCSSVVVSPTSLSLEVPQIHGSLIGPISADGNTVYASWKQGGSELSLVMKRQSAAIEARKAALDPAMPPVPVEQIQAVMDQDLAAALAAGELAPVTGQGVTIGVVVHGVRRIFTYGAAKTDSVFEIGSITKTFTGLILAQMVEQRMVRLDEPVRALLPPGTVAALASGAEIELVDLSAQRSGLPRIPDNMHPADQADPYADYDAKALYSFVASHGVAMPSKPQFEYSNLGVGLLGAALAHIALNWFRTDETGSYWHNGAKGGYSAFSLFNPERDVAVVVLSNSSVGEDGDFTDDLGRHVVQRLTGRPAVSLAPAAH